MTGVANFGGSGSQVTVDPYTPLPRAWEIAAAWLKGDWRRSWRSWRRKTTGKIRKHSQASREVNTIGSRRG